MIRICLLTAAIALLAFAFYKLAFDNEITYPPGILVPEVPRQMPLAKSSLWEKDGYWFKALAKFSLEARVLSKERYWFGREADLCPFDLALGWGPMSDQKILDQLTIRQNGRRYYWWPKQPTLSYEEINSHSANMHLIPANDEIKAMIKQIRRGDIITLRGYLVAVQSNDGWHWRSSLSRTDRGDGACEVIWVDSLAIRY
ncbi:MAG: hypothetical protein ONB44_19785 [candidate division KSB1 bacterium]|nr:hypothetical protein [candidate division KSB1 bacterium]MDZ7304371.1 hypothetical protein [candidate division KSB1 bacterium]MDZ7313520.1 hypothetical protein [candidate division KSB1 bacterium]